MSIQNLAIVFGPTLFGQIAPSMDAHGQANGGMADAGHQNKVSLYLNDTTISNLLAICEAVQTILEHYIDIFVDEADGQ